MLTDIVVRVETNNQDGNPLVPFTMPVNFKHWHNIQEKYFFAQEDS